MTPEKRVQNAIIVFLKTHSPIYIERRQAGGFNYKAGLPDVWFVYRGRHTEVEVKAPGGTASTLQLRHEDELRAAGCLYWRGSSADEFKKWFGECFPESNDCE